MHDHRRAGTRDLLHPGRRRAPNPERRSERRLALDDRLPIGASMHCRRHIRIRQRAVGGRDLRPHGARHVSADPARGQLRRTHDRLSQHYGMRGALRGHERGSFNPTAPTSASTTPQSYARAAGYGLNAFACPTAAQCTAVGHGTTAGGVAVGGEVTFAPTAPTEGAPSTIGGTQSLVGVECPSTTQCTAIDQSGVEVTFNPLSPAACRERRSRRRRRQPSRARPSRAASSSTDSGSLITGDPQSRSKWTVNGSLGANAFVAVACPSLDEGVAVDAIGDAYVGTDAAPKVGAAAVGRGCPYPYQLHRPRQDRLRVALHRERQRAHRRAPDRRYRRGDRQRQAPRREDRHPRAREGEHPHWWHPRRATCLERRWTPAPQEPPARRAQLAREVGVDGLAQRALPSNGASSCSLPRGSVRRRVARQLPPSARRSTSRSVRWSAADSRRSDSGAALMHPRMRSRAATPSGVSTTCRTRRSPS